MTMLRAEMPSQLARSRRRADSGKEQPSTVRVLDLDAPSSRSGADRPWLWTIAAVAAVAWALTARMAGPSDLWDQTQPKTIAYTTDILVNGGWSWILPQERGDLAATKPPLYNWLAAPFVWAMGFDSELGHKMPSVLALVACCVVVAGLGRAFDERQGARLGAAAALILVSNYTIFKLGYLARPDMLLTLWLTLAWACATAVLLRHENSRWWLIAAFWLCVALAALTKGPPALIAVAYWIVAARLIGGSWRRIGALSPYIGLPLVIAVASAWVAGVWILNPEHLHQQLWFNEIYGRITGLGPEGNRKGPIGWYVDLPNQSAYWLVRFAPWSFCALAAMFAMWRSRRRFQEASGRVASTASQWRRAAVLYILLVIGLYTLSAGKRADYLAASFPPSALLAAWWLLGGAARPAAKLPWLIPATAALVLAGLTAVNYAQPIAPTPNFGNEILQFARTANAHIRDNPAPVAFYWIGDSHLQALMGDSRIPTRDRIEELIAGGEPFWIVAGVRESETATVDQWLGSRGDVQIREVIQSAVLPRLHGWPEQVALYRVDGDPARWFVHRTKLAIAREPMPVVYWLTLGTGLARMIGVEDGSGITAVRDHIQRGEPFWLVAGQRSSQPHDCGEFLNNHPRHRVVAEPVIRPAPTPPTERWPGQITLFRVRPRD